MSLKAVSKKLQKTRLFSDGQKVDLFVKLAEASDEDIAKLEEGIDAFDRAYEKAMNRRSKEALKALETVLSDMSPEEKQRNQDTIDEIVMGIALLQPSN
jgi:predicted outer membrane protein